MGGVTFNWEMKMYLNARLESETSVKCQTKSWDKQNHHRRLQNKVRPAMIKQCDQMVRLFFNIWPFETMKISPIMSQICPSRLSILPNKNKLSKNFQTYKFLQNGGISPNLVTLWSNHEKLNLFFIHNKQFFSEIAFW